MKNTNGTQEKTMRRQENHNMMHADDLLTIQTKSLHRSIHEQAAIVLATALARWHDSTPYQKKPDAVFKTISAAWFDS